MTAPNRDTAPSPVSPSDDFAFDRETAIELNGPGRWSTTIRSDWNIRENPNGGYAMSPLLRAMAADVAGHPDPVSVTTHFLRPAIGDAAADLSVDVLRSGRRTATVRGSMTQRGKVGLETIATFADLSNATAPDFALDVAPPVITGPEDCLNRREIIQDVDIALTNRVEVRIDPSPAGPQAAGTDSDGQTEATISGWIRFLDGREPDSRALVLFADCFPPSVFNAFGRTGWIPTIELTVHVRRRPAPGWIQAQFTTRELAGDFLIEDGLLWDERGRVVAQSRQLALMAR